MASVKPWDPRTTYRVRQLPSYLEDRYDAVALLVRLESSLGPAENIRMFPLASSPNTWERYPSKTTTVMFKSLPAVLDNGRNECVLHARQAGYAQNVIIDSHFLDFTTFNDVRPDIHEIDCIAISGLSSHPFGSWRSHGVDPSFMWLRDKLPYDMPNLRSMIYGYDTQLLQSSSIQTVDDIANSFINKLSSIGRTSLSAKPLIILAHSLGGIIVKRALVLLANSGETQQFILSLVKMVVLFGVPSSGMEIGHLLPMIEGRPNENLVRILSPGSAFLATLEDQFNGISSLRHTHLISVFETGLSRTFQESNDGSWTRTGAHSLLVERPSAVAKGTKDADVIPVDQDHSNLVKFAEDDHNYRAVLLRMIAVDEKEAAKSQIPMSLTAAQSKQRNVESQDKVWRKALVNDEDQERREKVLKSLKVDVSHDRLHDIKEAHEDTFEWIFEDETIGFKRWLQGQSESIFWIQGKPGSGKSTLMKYILKDTRTIELIQQRKHSGDLIQISFFFHNRGSHLQKSFEGLYRTMLHTILCRVPDLTPQVCSILAKGGKLQQLSWNLLDLEDAFMSILGQTMHEFTIILFLDALDEYDGPPEAIARFVKQAIEKSAQAPVKLQICFSSRSWTHFLDQFGTCPGLRIQDYTIQDIRRYAFSRLGPKSALSQIRPTNAAEHGLAFSRLTEMIVERANGVFLWVRLVVDEVLRHATDQNAQLGMSATIDSTSIEQLAEIVSSFPDELEDLYRRTIERFSDQRFARIESYVMFELVLRSFWPLSVLDFAAATACATSRTVNESSTFFPSNLEGSQFLASFVRKLKSRCGGLIEIRNDGKNETVQFMHQTVKDFASTPTFRLILLGSEDKSATENGFTYLSKYTLTLLTNGRTNYMGSRYGGNLFQRDCLDYSYNSELTTGRSQREFLDSVKDEHVRKAYAEHFSKERIQPNQLGYAQPLLSPARMPINSVMSFAVVSNLQLYVLQKLSAGTSPNQNPTQSLLHCVSAVLITRAGTSISNMVDILLSYHADRELRLGNMTAFQMIFYFHSEHSKTNGHAESTNRAKSVIEVFLNHGQDPNVDIFARGPIAYSGGLTCKPIHVADSPLLRLLLEHNADVNGLDEHGRTALDLCCYTFDEIGKDRDPFDAYEVTVLLLDHGGCVTNLVHTPCSWNDRQTFLECFIEQIAKYIEPDSRMLAPPLLVEKSTEPNRRPQPSDGRSSGALSKLTKRLSSLRPRKKT